MLSDAYHLEPWSHTGFVGDSILDEADSSTDE